MKKIILIAIFCLSSSIAFSQIGMGTISPSASAALDITSTTKGFLIPRMTHLQKMAIQSPVAGLQVWCTDCGTYGESQVYNGTTWTNLIGGSAATTSPPDSPTNTIVTAYNAQASVSFTAPVHTGTSAITGYTATASPGGLTATGTSSPIVFTNLNGGTSYSFTVVATNASGNSVASDATSFTTNCGAYIAAGTWKQFKCYNLGATDTTSDPNVPIQGIHGNYYQWGIITPKATASDSAGGISGWNTTAAADGAWSDTINTANDPCPTGYRIPTSTQFSYINATTSTFNSVTRTGTWSDSATNFGSAIHFGTSSGVKSLTLPACGNRQYNNNGLLETRGSRGVYWSSTSIGTTAAIHFQFTSYNTQIINTTLRTFGLSIRCISE
jgi:uncharacterized protein (TIGR02145 family)